MGVDCVGLLIVALADIGIEAQDMPGYRRTVDGPRFIDNIRNQTEYCATPEPGTIGIFRDGTQPCHVGIFTEKNGVIHLLHASSAVGKVIEEPFIHDWPSLLMEIRKIKELD